MRPQERRRDPGRRRRGVAPEPVRRAARALQPVSAGQHRPLRPDTRAAGHSPSEPVSLTPETPPSEQEYWHSAAAEIVPDPWPVATVAARARRLRSGRTAATAPYAHAPGVTSDRRTPPASGSSPCCRSSASPLPSVAASASRSAITGSVTTRQRRSGRPPVSSARRRARARPGSSPGSTSDAPRSAATTARDLVDAARSAARLLHRARQSRSRRGASAPGRRSCCSSSASSARSSSGLPVMRSSRQRSRWLAVLAGSGGFRRRCRRSASRAAGSSASR